MSRCREGVEPERLYLSGRMTNQPGFNFPQFDSAAAALRAQCYAVVSPAEHDREVVAKEFNAGRIPYRRPEDVPGYAEGDVVAYQQHAGSVHDLLAWDFKQIIDVCDGIALLPGWEHSSGARAERFVAEAVGKHIYLVDRFNGGDWTLASDVEQRRMHNHVAEFSLDSPELASFKEEHPEIPWEANLGCATTRQLLAEVTARMKGQNSMNGLLLADLCSEAVSEKGLAPGILDYRTSTCESPKPLVPLKPFHDLLRREVVAREADNEAHYQAIFAAITDDVPTDSFAHVQSRQSIHVIDREVRVVDPSTGGAKGAKAQAMHLIPGDALLAISEHLNKGAEKYAERNWELGYAWSLSFAAMQRHLWAWWQGEDNDPEFGWSHLRAVGFHALVLLAFELRGAGTDDRPTTPQLRWEAEDLR